MLTQLLLFAAAVAFAACAIIAVLEITKTKKKQRDLDSKLSELPDKDVAEREYAALQRRNREYKQAIEREASKLKQGIDQYRQQAESLQAEARQKVDLAKTELLQANEFLREHATELSAFEHGFFPKVFSFDEPQQYKDAIRALEDNIKQLIAQQAACRISEQPVFEAKKENERFVKCLTKLLIQAFSAASSEICSEVSPSNFVSKKAKLDKAYEKLNNATSGYGVTISDAFRIAHQEFLKLTFEHKLKVKEQREYDRQIREQIREETRAEKERQQALDKAEKEERLARDAYAKAERQIEAKLAAISSENNEERERLQEQLESLKSELAAAHEKAERAKSQAELTKTGNVYVLSNIGTMGDRVYKVGMTRRLDPMDRVKELSDASVPFLFDCHCMIATDNAPELEKALHKELNVHRVNKINVRKEFFKCDLDDIVKAILKHNGSLPDRFITEPLAEEYYASLGYAELDANDTADAVGVLVSEDADPV